MAFDTDMLRDPRNPNDPVDGRAPIPETARRTIESRPVLVSFPAGFERGSSTRPGRGEAGAGAPDPCGVKLAVVLPPALPCRWSPPSRLVIRSPPGCRGAPTPHQFPLLPRRRAVVIPDRE
jgi:hypothetical protein